MKKVLLFGTMLGVATTALAFGGIFNHGNKSTTYKGGVNAIGVHIGGEGQVDIDIRNCDSETEELVGTECCLKTLVYEDGGVAKCCSTEGYAVQDGQCKKQCGEGLVLNEETNECEDACPAERQCGDICCGEGNVCHPELNVCCKDDYEDFGEDWMDRCCPAGSVGKDYYGECCEIGDILASNDTDSYCCPAGSIGADIDGQCCESGTMIVRNTAGEPFCCPPNSTGYGGEDGCCPEGTIVVGTEEYGDHCCPANSTGFDIENWECI